VRCDPRVRAAVVRDLLAVAQIGGRTVLLTGAGLLLKSF
jgi:hypothetical protein